MTGTLLMQALVLIYIVTAIVFATEGNWPKCLYWCGAAVITTSVLWMK